MRRWALAQSPKTRQDLLRLELPAELAQVPDAEPYLSSLADVVRRTEDYAEGRLSFREKRPPRYMGR